MKEGASERRHASRVYHGVIKGAFLAATAVSLFFFFFQAFLRHDLIGGTRRGPGWVGRKSPLCRAVGGRADERKRAGVTER